MYKNTIKNIFLKGVEFFMAKDRNYTGTTRFIEDATVLTADYGYTGDIAFEVKPGETTTTTEYVEATSTDAGALKVVADDASPFDAETQIKISDVTGITVEVGDYVTIFLHERIKNRKS